MGTGFNHDHGPRAYVSLDLGSKRLWKNKESSCYWSLLFWQASCSYFIFQPFMENVVPNGWPICRDTMVLNGCFYIRGGWGGLDCSNQLNRENLMIHLKARVFLEYYISDKKYLLGRWNLKYRIIVFMDCAGKVILHSRINVRGWLKYRNWVASVGLS